jgi:hypothetical protein
MKAALPDDPQLFELAVHVLLDHEAAQKVIRGETPEPGMVENLEQLWCFGEEVEVTDDLGPEGDERSRAAAEFIRKMFELNLYAMSQGQGLDEARSMLRKVRDMVGALEDVDFACEVERRADREARWEEMARQWEYQHEVMEMVGQERFWAWMRGEAEINYDGFDPERLPFRMQFGADPKAGVEEHKNRRAWRGARLVEDE